MPSDLVGWSIGAVSLAIAVQQAWKARGIGLTLERLERAKREKARPDSTDPAIETDLLSDVDSTDRKVLADAISELPEREKLVLTLYYYEELTMREIGEVLGVTESRVSQIHKKAILRLKARLARASSFT